MSRANRRPRPAAAPPHDPLWFKDAVIYQLHLKSFFDSNDDGIGDFAGLIAKLDYIAWLGVNTIWLLPFYPSPRRDDGYDIAAYKDVHPDYGTLADARRFVAEAHRRGLRVITELVINHTSDQHPWFQRAREARPGSSTRDFYVWSDSDQKYSGTRIIFCDTEKSNWTWDPVANAFYWHRFYSHQPDLNFDNPQVLRAVLGVMRFWLDIGVDGLRLDAVPYLKEREGTNNENLPETHDVLKRIRAELDREYPDRMLLAEANQWPEDTRDYFGDGDECHMAFHFPLMPRMYMALAQEDRFPLMDILRQTPDIPENCQWAIFLRNHDELTLEMVTDRERDYLWETYASNPRARINLGIRRRLAPLLDNDRRRIELLNSLLLSMPGTPVIYYGDEIMMGDNIYLGDRDGVRTPMQWSLDRNGGFSRADPSKLVLPPIMDTLYGYGAINVEAQRRDEHSLLHWTHRMLAIRSRHQVFGRGTLRLLYPSNRRIFAYLREFTDADGRSETVLCVANVGRSAQAVELDLAAFAGCVPVEMLGGASFPPIGQLPYLLTLPPYGFYWFTIASAAQMPAWHSVPPQPLPELITLILRRGIEDVLQPGPRGQLERDILPAWLGHRRWFAGKADTVQSVRLRASGVLPLRDAAPVLFAEVEVESDRETVTWQLPLGFIREDELVGPLPQQLALARARRGPTVGFLTDALALPQFGHALLDALRERLRLRGEAGEIRFEPGAALDTLQIDPGADIRWLGSEQSNSSLVVGNAAIIKLFRRLSPGVHPEAEMGRRLTAAGYQNCAPLLGEIVRHDADGGICLLAIVQAYRHSQGDGWYWMLGQLERLLGTDSAQAHAALLADPAAQGIDGSVFEEMQRFAAALGRRLGEMHAVLARPSDDPAFAPAIAGQAQAQHWSAQAGARLDAAFALIEARVAAAGSAMQPTLRALLAKRDALRDAVARLAARGIGSLQTRTHGDLHLGQVLVSQDDAFFIDFEGEPSRPLAERREKTSPLRDVAGMLRSFDYVAAMAARGHAGASIEPERVEAVLARFRSDIPASFLAAYREATDGIGHHWADAAAADDLLRLFEIDKAAYEVGYEAANRPDWIDVPLSGLLRLAAAPHAGTEQADG